MKTTFLLLARLLIGVVLFAAGFSKAVGPTAEFAAAIEAYHLLPAALLPLVAMILPWLELYVGTYLFFGYFARFFAGVASGLFAIFLIVLSSAILRGIDLSSCGCFGGGLPLSPRQTIGIDTVLFLAAMASCLSRPPQIFSLDRWIENK